MTIPVRVPLHLRRRSEAGEPAAVFLPGRDASALLSACARLGVDPSNRVRAVAGGFVVELNRPTAGPFVLPGAVRLRELAPGLLVPVDAELVPALLDDERAGLVRDGGLVFLPDGRVLRYDRRAAVAISALIAAPPAPRRGWQPLPEPRRLAERIIEIARDEPDASPEDLYDRLGHNLSDPTRDRRNSGRGEGGGEEGAGAAAGGEESAGLGGALRGLLGRAGAGARSLGESMRWSGLDQSQLLRKLLREFRQGDPARALRHALPVSEAGHGGRSRVPLGGRLPFSRAIYSLMELLGGPRRGQDVGVWSAPPDLVAELPREYHRLAQAAQRQGDYRRAAYIYGKLLGDDRSAAMALRRGGLDHDAAILLLVKVRDEAAAAEAFEAAGEHDRAIALYIKLGRFEQAGDLRHRMGDEAGASLHYRNAIRALMKPLDRPTDWLEVGRIFQDKLHDQDLALEAYRDGWAWRPESNAMACALRLLRIHAARGGGEPIARLLDEADIFLRDRGAHDARDFYNEVAAIAADEAGAGLVVDDVRDRALRVLAHHARRLVADTAGASAPVVSALFTDPTLWTPAIARDAQFAAARASAARRVTPPVRNVTSVAPLRARVMRVGRATVTAVASAPASCEGFLGFDDGQIHAVLRDQDRTERVGDVGGPIAALATEPMGRIVVALRHTEIGSVLTSFLRWPDGGFRRAQELHHRASTVHWLSPIHGSENLIALCDEQMVSVYDASSWISQSQIPRRPADSPPVAGLLVPHLDAIGVLLQYVDLGWVLYNHEGSLVAASLAPGQAITGGRHPRCTVPATCLPLPSGVRFAGVDGHGSVQEVVFSIKDDAIELTSVYHASVEGGFLAVVPTWNNRVIAATSDRLIILGRRAGSAALQELTSGAHASGPIAACFLAKDLGEVVLVDVDGWVSRVSLPTAPPPPRKGRVAQ